MKNLPKGTNIIIVNDFDYIQGGASKVAIDTANLLVENIEDINVYFFSGDHKENSNLNKKVIKVCTNQGEALRDKNKIRGFFNGIYNFKAKKEFKKLLKSLDRKNTIIHVHGWTKCLSSSIFDVAFKMKYKLVLTMHDYFTACPNGGYYNYKKNEICHLNPMCLKCIKCNCDSRNYLFKLYRVIRQRKYNNSFKKLKNVIAISDFSLEILKKTLPKDVSITRINNPIEFNQNEELINIEKNKYYLYVGRISREKGVDLFCQALTELNLPGIVVGDGEEKEKLKEKYPNIEFVGWKNSDEVKQYMKKSKMLIMPSRWYECAPLTNLEALSVGLPSIVSSNCAASDVSNKKNKTGDTFDLNVNTLKNRIINYNYINFSKEYVIQFLDKFSHKNYVEKVVDTYKKII